jgi:hypothetical protein
VLYFLVVTNRLKHSNDLIDKSMNIFKVIDLIVILKVYALFCKFIFGTFSNCVDILLNPLKIPHLKD